MLSADRGGELRQDLFVCFGELSVFEFIFLIFTVLCAVIVRPKRGSQRICSKVLFMQGVPAFLECAWEHFSGAWAITLFHKAKCVMAALIRLESQLSRSHTQSLLKRRTSSLLVHHGHMDLLFAAICVLHEFFISYYILHLLGETHHAFIEIASFIHLSSRFSDKRRLGDIELIVEVLVKQDLSSQWLLSICICNWLRN